MNEPNVDIIRANIRLKYANIKTGIRKIKNGVTAKIISAQPNSVNKRTYKILSNKKKFFRLEIRKVTI